MEALKSDGAPFPAGWYFLERVSGSLFGSTELVLRLPTALFLPIGCVLLMLLARRWMPISAAVVVALVGTLTGTLVGYATQVSEYQLDAAAVVAVVLFHEIVWGTDRPTWRSTRVYLAYGGIALACVFSTPAVFIAGPLLLLDAVRLVMRRRLGPQLVGAVVSGVIVLAHLKFFVLPQNALTKSNFGIRSSCRTTVWGANWRSWVTACAGSSPGSSPARRKRGSRGWSSARSGPGC